MQLSSSFFSLLFQKRKRKRLFSVVDHVMKGHTFWKTFLLKRFSVLMYLCSMSESSSLILLCSSDLHGLQVAMFFLFSFFYCHLRKTCIRKCFCWNAKKSFSYLFTPILFCPFEFLYNKQIHSSLIYTGGSRGREAGGYFQHSTGDRWGSTWTGWQSIAGNK